MCEQCQERIGAQIDRDVAWAKYMLAHPTRLRVHLVTAGYCKPGASRATLSDAAAKYRAACRAFIADHGPKNLVTATP